MAINVNIGGINKNVISPQVNINGTWRQVNTVKNNINGVWKTSYSNTYKIKLYRYGTLYQTLSVTKGSSVTLPSVPTVQSDDIEHYGWTKTSGSTTRNYSATAKITPTSDMELFAVYSYETTSGGTESLTCYQTTKTVTLERSGTCKISGTYEVSTPNGTQVSTMSLGTSTSDYIYCKIGTTFVTGVLGESATPITFNATAGQTLTVKAANSSDTYNTFFRTIYVDYPVNVITTRYRS